MLPIVAVAAVATGAAAAVVRRANRGRTSKPQRRFRTRLADNSDAPFQHLSPAAAAAAAAICGDGRSDGVAAVASSTTHEGDTPAEQHPFAARIHVLMAAPHNPFPCSSSLPAEPPPLAGTPLVWVDTPVKLRRMLADLEGVACIGVDTEHNSHRSYLGLLCLLQLSTGACLFGRRPCCSSPLRTHWLLLWCAAVPSGLPGTHTNTRNACSASLPNPPVALPRLVTTITSPFATPALFQTPTGAADYIIDTLALHDSLALLRPLLADARVVKVLHGAANDVMWLQREAHLYLVNIFDTEKAAQV